jgi:hypothetical protein
MYFVGCEGVGTEEALCYCWQEEGMICDPTTDDAELACMPADQCCGFPTSGEAEFDEWGDGCESEWWDGVSGYWVMCEGLGTEDAFCLCEEWEDEDW